MALEGSLSDMSLIDLLQVFWSGHRSGRLLLTGSSQRAMLWFMDGRVVNAAVLSHTSNKPVLVGEAAVFNLLQWEDAAFKFFAPKPGEQYPVVIDHATDWLILEGMRRREQSAPPIHTRLSMQSQLELVPSLGAQGSSISLSLDEWRILSQIVEPTTIEQLATGIGIPHTQALAIVDRLVALGVLRVYTPAPPPARPSVQLTQPAAGPGAAPSSAGLLGIIRSIKSRISRIGLPEQHGWQTTKL